MRRTFIVTLTLFFIMRAIIGAENGGEGQMALICKYCGREARPSAGGKLTWQGSDKCGPSPGGKHVLLPVPGHCVYCGREVRASPGGVLTWQGSAACSASPSKKHQLQD
jgi:ribosomal protein S27E